MTRMLAARASSSSFRSRAAPSAPISLNPAEMTMAPRTPFSPHSLMIPGMEGGGRNHHRQIHLLGDVRNGLVGLDSQDVGTLGVHRKHGAAERAGHQVPQQRAAHGVGILGGADHGDGFRGEEDIQGLFPPMLHFLAGSFSYWHGFWVSALCPDAAWSRVSSHVREFEPISRAMVSMKIRSSLGATLPHVTDDHVAADQWIESKHPAPFRGNV